MSVLCKLVGHTFVYDRSMGMHCMRCGKQVSRCD